MAKDHAHECSYGPVPSFIFRESGGKHGNFHPESYQAILSHPEWKRRLDKAYTSSRFVPRRWDRQRSELDCASSSDALLMNIFCYPGLLESSTLRSVLGVGREACPFFGFKPGVPLVNQRRDQTEVDMSLDHLLVEAKLTETGFQKCPIERLHRYRDLQEIFDVEHLPVCGNSVSSYQLVRGVLAAHDSSRSFVVFCDARRVDLIEGWFRIMRVVRPFELRSRLALLTWQELASLLPPSLKTFLSDKYGIAGR